MCLPVVTCTPLDQPGIDVPAELSIAVRSSTRHAVDRDARRHEPADRFDGCPSIVSGCAQQGLSVEPSSPGEDGRALARRLLDKRSARCDGVTDRGAFP